MGTFYEKQLKIRLSWWDRRALFPIWHIINIISDLLITSGSISKILLDFFVSLVLACMVCMVRIMHTSYRNTCRYLTTVHQ